MKRRPADINAARNHVATSVRLVQDTEDAMANFGDHNLSNRERLELIQALICSAAEAQDEAAALMMGLK